MTEGAHSAAETRAGFAEQTITPPIGSVMAGYFEPHRAEEIIDDLHVKAFYLESGATRLALVCGDVIALDRHSVARIRQSAAGRTGLPAGNILVAALHNHTGPQTVPLFGQPADEAYLVHLESRAAAALEDACSRAAPVRFRAASALEERLNCNRRLILKDGTVHTHLTDADLKDVTGREGPSDPEVIVLAAEEASGQIQGLLVNYALHPTNVRGDRICSDYPGYLALSVRAALGGGVITVFANGACGNLDSKTPELAGVEYGPGRARRIGETLGETVRGALAKARPLCTSPMKVAREMLHLPVKQVPEDCLERARDFTPGREDPFFTLGTRRPSALKERVYAEEALRVDALRRVSPEVEAEVQVMRLGDIAIVGIPVELFTEFGLHIKEAARTWYRHVIVIELANGYLGYVPTPASFEGGGYETRVACSSMLAPEAGDLLTSAALRLLESLAG